MIQGLRASAEKVLKMLHLYDFFYEKVYGNRFFFQAMLCGWRYRRLLRLARKKSPREKVRVLFIVSEIAKWKEQTLYEAMESSGDFYPIVGISAWNKQRHLSPQELEQVHVQAEAFFDKMGCRHLRTVTCEGGVKKFHALSEFSPDIVFYTEQWSPCPGQDPRSVSRYAITCFLPYYVPDFGIIQIDCHQPVARLCCFYYCLNEAWSESYCSSMRLVVHTSRYVATGHPALDRLAGGTSSRIPGEGYVIYAPHFSFPRPQRQDFYTIGTFDWNGAEILAYAEAHPEINWVFKPHPILRASLKDSGLMSQDQVEDYYDRWSKIAVTSFDADYQNLFLQSRVMITDSGSFLPEYGSTGRPVIRLICRQNDHIPPEAARRVYDTYYNVHNLDEMYAVFKAVVEQGQDPNREVRLEAVRSAGLMGCYASGNIVNHLLGVYRRK